MVVKIILAPSSSTSYKSCQHNDLILAAFKSTYVRPLLKKPNLNQNTLMNYRPVSNLPFLSKILKNVVNSRIKDHLASNNLHEEHQSAYR